VQRIIWEGPGRYRADHAALGRGAVFLLLAIAARFGLDVVLGALLAGPTARER
jgi:hypothetical protein